MATTTRSKAARGAAANTPPEAPAKKETLQQLKNRLRNEAEREVLNKYKAEVIQRTEAKYKEHNLEYVRRLTDEEKAQKEIQEHLAKYPGLREQLIAGLTGRSAPEGYTTSGPIVEAVPGGALATFRAADYEAREVEAREGE